MRAPVSVALGASLPLLASATLGTSALLGASPASAAPDCSAEFLIDETLPSGARWRMCWEHRQREGIVLWDVSYTPAGGSEVMVLRKGNIAQIHVPYDDNGARYHDVSDYGLGGNRMNDLTPADCPSGALVRLGAKDVICKRVLPRDESHATDQPGGRVLGDALSLFSVSHIGAYNYIPDWRFHDDGSIVPWMGATGQLQRRRTGSQYADIGWKIRSGETYGVSHLHNYYWRLDFDLGGTANNDVVEQLEAVDANGGLRREQRRETLTSEAARSIAPERRRSWRIADGAITNAAGNPISWHIEPRDTGHRDVGPANEPWTFNDVYFTVNKDCEVYASHNPQANGCGENVSEFVDGQSLAGADLVAWYGITFHHIPRDEDEARMPAHWNSFEIRARDVHDETPLLGDINEAPTLDTPPAQVVTEGEAFSLALVAGDPDGDTLSYSATGLPAGIAAPDSSGLIAGTPAAGTAGSYTVIATVSDGALSDSATFSLVVSAANAPPVLTRPAAQSAVEGEAFSLALTASDPDGDALGYSATGLPPGLGVTPGSNVISGAAEAGSAGVYTVTATVNDGSLTDSESFSLTVESPPPTDVVLLEADFDAGVEGFAYRGDAFRGTDAVRFNWGQYLAQGGYSGGGLEVKVGNRNNDDIYGMSGAWERAFVLAEPGSVTVELRYKLVQSPHYEGNETSDLLVSVDGVLLGQGINDYVTRIAGDGGGGPDVSTGWRKVVLTTAELAAGTHTLALGAYNSLKTSANEFTLATFDEVVVRGGAAESTALASASFDAGAEGFVYGDDRFRGSTAPSYADGGFAADAGRSGGGLRVTLGGQDNVNVNGMSGGFDLAVDLDAPAALTITFDYRLAQTPQYEWVERSEVLVAVDGALVSPGATDYVARIRNGNPSAGWQSVTIVTEELGAGSHTLTFGVWNNLKTWFDEVTTLEIDNVLVER